MVGFAATMGGMTTGREPSASRLPAPGVQGATNAAAAGAGDVATRGTLDPTGVPSHLDGLRRALSNDAEAGAAALQPPRTIAAASTAPGESVTVLLVLSMALATCAFGLPAALRSMHPPTAPLAIRTTVNPNTAPWWELAAVPRVGPALAQMIVAHREQSPTQPAFRQAADLDHVPGIGPATVRVIAPFMHFE